MVEGVPCSAVQEPGVPGKTDPLQDEISYGQGDSAQLGRRRVDKKRPGTLIAAYKGEVWDLDGGGCIWRTFQRRRLWALLKAEGLFGGRGGQKGNSLCELGVGERKGASGY